MGARLEHESRGRASCRVRVVKKGDAVLCVAENWTRGLRPTKYVSVESRHITRLSAQYLWCGIGARLLIADRGITWCPAWREKEADAFLVAFALRTVE